MTVDAQRRASFGGARGQYRSTTVLTSSHGRPPRPSPRNLAVCPAWAHLAWSASLGNSAGSEQAGAPRMACLTRRCVRPPLLCRHDTRCVRGHPIGRPRPPPQPCRTASPPLTSRRRALCGCDPPCGCLSPIRPAPRGRCATKFHVGACTCTHRRPGGVVPGGGASQGHAKRPPCNRPLRSSPAPTRAHASLCAPRALEQHGCSPVPPLGRPRAWRPRASPSLLWVPVAWVLF